VEDDPLIVMRKFFSLSRIVPVRLPGTSLFSLWRCSIFFCFLLRFRSRFWAPDFYLVFPFFPHDQSFFCLECLVFIFLLISRRLLIDPDRKHCFLFNVFPRSFLCESNPRSSFLFCSSFAPFAQKPSHSVEEFQAWDRYRPFLLLFDGPALL